MAVATVVEANYGDIKSTFDTGRNIGHSSNLGDVIGNAARHVL